MVKFFSIPFAASGTKSAVPDASQPDGSVSYTDGFGQDYQLDPATDPAALDVPRDQFNQLMNDATAAIGEIQQYGFPKFTTAAYPYDTDAVVRWIDGFDYISLVAANSTDPTNTTNWVRAFGNSVPVEPTGVGKDYWGIILPSGYVWGNGTTIGSAASGATGRANADTSALFVVLWGAMSNVNLPIQDSTGSPSVRGISAAADFSANKRLPTPDKRDVVSIGKGDMGGTADRGLITVPGSGLSATTMGAFGGVETVQLTGNQNGIHTHTGTTDSAGVHNHTYGPTLINSDNGYLAGGQGSFARAATGGVTNNAGAHSHNITMNNSGLGAEHQNIQPSFVCNYIIKL